MTVRLPILALAALLLGAAGCTITEVFEDGERVGRSIAPGFARLPAPGDRSLAIRTRGLGVQVAPGSTAVGWFRASTIYFAPSCTAMFVVRDDAQTMAIRDTFGPLDEICITEGG